MFIRWERSNVRENIMMSKFAFGDFREEPKVGTRILLCMQWLKLVMSYPLMLLMLWFIINHTMLFISSTLLGILIFSSVQAFFFAKRNKNTPEAFWPIPIVFSTPLRFSGSHHTLLLQQVKVAG